MVKSIMQVIDFLQAGFALQDGPERRPLEELGDIELSEDEEEVKIHPPPTAEVVAATIAAAADVEVI